MAEQPQDWWPPGVTHWEGPPLQAWDAWSPVEAGDQLSRSGAAWCVVGGWAIDLAADRTTRVHEDLEVAVPLDDFGAIRAVLSDFELYRVGDGQVRRLREDFEPSTVRHQNWVLDPVAQRWRLAVMTEPGDRETWVFRRDPRITAPRATMVGVNAQGIPYLRPHGVLLYKAKNIRDKDEHDRRLASTLMTPAERRWLVSALGVVHPGHAWLGEL